MKGKHMDMLRNEVADKESERGAAVDKLDCKNETIVKKRPIKSIITRKRVL